VADKKSLFPAWVIVGIAAIGGVIGAGASGALGDMLFKPVFTWLGESILTVATLGLAAVRDSLYVDIAKGNYERASLLFVSLFFGILSGGLIGIILAALFKSPPKDTAKPREINFFAGFSILLLFGIFAGYLLIAWVRVSYVVRAAAHIEQFQRVVAPYVPDSERIKMASSVAQIKSRADYVAVIDQMTKIANDNHLVVPTFDVF